MAERRPLQELQSEDQGLELSGGAAKNAITKGIGVWNVVCRLSGCNFDTGGCHLPGPPVLENQGPGEGEWCPMSTYRMSKYRILIPIVLATLLPGCISRGHVTARYPTFVPVEPRATFQSTPGTSAGVPLNGSGANKSGPRLTPVPKSSLTPTYPSYPSAGKGASQLPPNQVPGPVLRTPVQRGAAVPVQPMAWRRDELRT